MSGTKKILKSAEGITLIALVITIIVLLILAGVSISMVIGNNGILNQAESAVVKTNKGSLKETLEMEVASWKIGEYAGDDITLKEYLEGKGYEVPKVEDGKYTVVVEGENGKEYIFVAEESGKVTEVTKKVEDEEETLLSLVNANKAEMYGKKVTGYEANGISDWRIFYSDDSNVYLITTDYLPNSKIPTAETGMTTTGTYQAYWSSAPSVADTTNASRFSPITSETMTWGGNYGTNANGKSVSTVLDSSKWTSFVDTNKADMAIGSPTLNMFVASWNEKYSDEKLYCNNSNATGYYVGNSTNPTSTYYDTSNMTGYATAEADNVYFPHKSEYSSCYGYWLASPSSLSHNDAMYVHYNGNVNYGNYNLTFRGVRPVVSLRSEILVDDVEIVQ